MMSPKGFREQQTKLTMGERIDANQIEDTILECRRLLTHSVTDLPEYSTIEKIRTDFPNFVRECHVAYKQALGILISQILAIENQVQRLTRLTVRRGNSLKEKIGQLKYWKVLLELSFNTFVWIAVGWDRSKVKKVFKGPKYGALTEQNIDLLLDYVNQANQKPEDFVVPLDFCRFCSIADLLRIRFKEPENTLKLDFIEAKSGNVNDEMLETIQSRQQSQYLDFFDKYGRKGIKQMERYFRQQHALIENLKLMHVEPGIYNKPSKEDERFIVCGNETIPEDYTGKVIQLLESSEKEEYCVDEIDECLVAGVINTKCSELAVLADFDIRLFIYHLYINHRVGRGPFSPFPPLEPYVKVSLHTAQAFLKDTLVECPDCTPQTWATIARYSRADIAGSKRASLLCLRRQK